MDSIVRVGRLLALLCPFRIHFCLWLFMERLSLLLAFSKKTEKVMLSTSRFYVACLIMKKELKASRRKKKKKKRKKVELTTSSSRRLDRGEFATGAN